MKRLLGMERFQDSRALGFAVGLLCLAVALVASTALLDITPKASAAGRVSVQKTSSSEDQAPVVAAAVTKLNSQSADSESDESKQKTAPILAGRDKASTESFVQGMKAVGLDELNVDQLVAMKIHGVTPEFVRGMQAQGLHPNAEGLIAMRVQM